MNLQPQRVRSVMVFMTLMALAGCLPTRHAQTSPIASGNPAAENALRNPTPQNFPKPIISEAGSGNPVGTDLKAPPLATVPVKGLMQSTPDRTQPVALNSGRDPFAASPATELQLPRLTFSPPKSRQSTTPVLSRSTAKPTANPVRSQKPAATAPLPRLRPANRPAANFPTVPVQNNPPPFDTPVPFPIAALPQISPTALADQVEITGVVQVGDRVMAIARSPEETSARYVNTGDRLSGGQVIVREIRTGGSPVVVLEQNGRKVVKSIGANRVASIR